MKHFFPYSQYYNQYIILFANAVDHTEIMLYTLITPWISAAFFPHHDPVIQLVLGYSVLLTAFVTKPLGALLFSVFAQKVNPTWALRASLLGSAVSMGLVMVCPEYSRFGPYAALAWLVARGLRGVFYAGQTTLSRIYTVELEHDKTAYTLSYLYHFSTLSGYVLASACASIYAYYPGLSWRWIGGFSLVFALCAWGVKHDDRAASRKGPPPFSWAQQCRNLKSHALPICMITLTTGVTYVTWNVAFVTLNALVPLATDISQKHMFAMNTALMWLDMLLILGLGVWLKRYMSKRIITCSVAVLGLSFPLVMALIDAYPCLLMVTLVRLWVVVWGVVLSCPLHLYYRYVCSKPHVYSVVAVGTILGGTIIGKATPALSVWLYHISGTFAAIGVYGAILCGLTYGVLRYMPDSDLK